MHTIKGIIEHIRTLRVDYTTDIVYPAIIFGALVILGLVMLLSQRKGK